MRLKRKDFLKGSLTAIFVWYRLNSCSWILNAAIEYRRTFWPPIYLALNAFVVRMTWTSQQSDGAQALVVRANLRLFRSELSTLHICKGSSHKDGSCDHVGLHQTIMSCRHLLLFSENLDQDGGLGLVVVVHLDLLSHPPPPHHHRCALLLLCGQGGPITVKVSPHSLPCR